MKKTTGIDQTMITTGISDDYLSITLSSDDLADPYISGGAGQVYTISDNGTASWDNSWLTANITSPLIVNGDATIEGELTINGVKLSERLDKIDERLGILHPNEELEDKWENLRGLRKAYMELEAEIKEKEKVWDILKK
jgi:hypothetical protein